MKLSSSLMKQTIAHIYLHFHKRTIELDECSQLSKQTLTRHIPICLPFEPVRRENTCYPSPSIPVEPSITQEKFFLYLTSTKGLCWHYCVYHVIVGSVFILNPVIILGRLIELCSRKRREDHIDS
jgi:hypothetical protein